jgi:hypothetical protein
MPLPQRARTFRLVSERSATRPSASAEIKRFRPSVTLLRLLLSSHTSGSVGVSVGRPLWCEAGRPRILNSGAHTVLVCNHRELNRRETSGHDAKACVAYLRPQGRCSVRGSKTGRKSFAPSPRVERLPCNRAASMHGDWGTMAVRQKPRPQGVTDRRKAGGSE